MCEFMAIDAKAAQVERQLAPARAERAQVMTVHLLERNSLTASLTSSFGSVPCSAPSRESDIILAPHRSFSDPVSARGLARASLSE